MLRILDSATCMLDLDELGLRRRTAARVPSAASPRPTASSWSPARPAPARPPRSTRRSTSSTRPSKNIITVEDPVEYQIDGHQPGPGQPARPGSPSPPACARSCARIPTSSWSARSATARRPRSPIRGGADRPPGALAPCTPTTPPAPSPAWSTWASSRSCRRPPWPGSWPSAWCAGSARTARRSSVIGHAKLRELADTPVLPRGLPESRADLPAPGLRALRRLRLLGARGRLRDARDD